MVAELSSISGPVPIISVQQITSGAIVWAKGIVNKIGTEFRQVTFSPDGSYVMAQGLSLLSIFDATDGTLILARYYSNMGYQFSINIRAILIGSVSSTYSSLGPKAYVYS
jgi:hypothetical protein